MGKVQALSLWQPWATLLVHGKKKVETRTWCYPVGSSRELPQVVAIHATKGWGRRQVCRLGRRQGCRRCCLQGCRWGCRQGKAGWHPPRHHRQPLPPGHAADGGGVRGVRPKATLARNLVCGLPRHRTRTFPRPHTPRPLPRRSRVPGAAGGWHPGPGQAGGAVGCVGGGGVAGVDGVPRVRRSYDGEGAVIPRVLNRRMQGVQSHRTPTPPPTRPSAGARAALPGMLGCRCRSDGGEPMTTTIDLQTALLDAHYSGDPAARFVWLGWCEDNGVGLTEAGVTGVWRGTLAEWLEVGPGLVQRVALDRVELVEKTPWYFPDHWDVRADLVGKYCWIVTTEGTTPQSLPLRFGFLAISKWVPHPTRQGAIDDASSRAIRWARRQGQGVNRG